VKTIAFVRSWLLNKLRPSEIDKLNRNSQHLIDIIQRLTWVDLLINPGSVKQNLSMVAGCIDPMPVLKQQTEVRRT